MPISTLYKHLKERISFLKKQFSDFPEADSSLPKNQDKLRAFKLLVHAEIESYVENAVLEIVNKCEHEWSTNQKMLPSLQFLILYATSKFEANDGQLKQEDRITQIITLFRNSIKNNNGIRRKNVLLLFVPIGVDYNTIDSAWLATLDSYGVSRGLVAHNTFSVQKQIDQKDELNNLKFVLAGIKKMDLKLQKLITGLRKPF